ncbi:MAG: ribonuclease E/G [Chlorobi bacterium]|nr:ribonuclease E/G [Chlorobiota bacterium]
MGIDLIVTSSPSAIDFAILKDGKLTELHREEQSAKFNVGDIYLAKVSKLMPGLNAAFIDLQSKKHGFLHYHDLGPKVRSLLKYIKILRHQKPPKSFYRLKAMKMEPEIRKDGAIQQVLQQGQPILVQIVKEPISTKGPRLTSELSLAGRYLVLVPFSDRVFVSGKIENEAEKNRLKRLAESIKPQNFGLIVRTAAEGRKVAELYKDLEQLMARWEELSAKVAEAKKLPVKVLSEPGRIQALLRDILSDEFRSIIVDDINLYHEIVDTVREIYPGKEKIVKYYDEPYPVFEKYGIEKQIKTSFGKTVSLGKGAYLIIEHTEAMHVIDVNSGVSLTKESDQESTALDVNLKAAKEIARQLQLRDMGGIIIVDFIDMKKKENRDTLYRFLREEMKTDRAKHKILPPTKFGLIQITRQRVRPERKIQTTEPDPSGSGKAVDAPVNLLEKIDNDLKKVVRHTKGKIILAVHPFIAAYLTKGWLSWRWRKMWQHRRPLEIQPRHGFRYLEYKFYDKDGHEIDMSDL